MAHKRFVVDDMYDVPVGGQVPIIASFDTAEEAAEYISTLPDYRNGRYGITDSQDPDAETR
jgi:hypothetical protein